VQIDLLGGDCALRLQIAAAFVQVDPVQIGLLRGDLFWKFCSWFFSSWRFSAATSRKHAFSPGSYGPLVPVRAIRD